MLNKNGRGLRSGKGVLRRPESHIDADATDQDLLDGSDLVVWLPPPISFRGTRCGPWSY